MKFLIQQIYSICQPGKSIANGSTLNNVVCIGSVVEFVLQKLPEGF